MKKETKLVLMVLMGGVAQVAWAQTWSRESLIMPETMSGVGGHEGESSQSNFSASAHVGVIYDDNVTLSPSKKAGFGVRTGADARFTYPVSRHNELAFDMAVDYMHYISGGAKDTSFTSILPGTETSFTIFTGPVRIRNFVSLKISEDPIDTPVVNRTARFGRLNADAGVQLDWDMNRIVWQGWAMAGRQLSTQSANSQINNWHYSMGIRPMFPISPALSVGVSLGYGHTDYDQLIQNGSDTMDVTGFAQFTLSEKQRVTTSVGYETSIYEHTGKINDSTDYHGIHASIEYNNQVSKNLNLSAYLRHDIDDGYGTNFYQTTDLRFTGSLRMARKWDFVGYVDWQWIEESGATGESAQRYGFGAELRHPLSRHMDFNVGWSYIAKVSSISTREYDQNQIYATVRYSF